MLACDIAFLPVTELLEPACSALFPGFALARRSGSEPVALGLSVAGALALLTIPFSIGVSACSGYLVTSLLGAKWEAARPIIAVLAWMCMFSPFSYVSGSVLSAQGQVSRVFASHALAAALKVSVVLAVRHTQNLQWIALSSVLIVAAETSIFMFQPRAAGNKEFRSLGMAMARALVSTAVTCAVVSQVPGAWAVVTMDRPYALFAGGSLGLLTLALFFACQGMLWHLAGQPAGPESRLAGVMLRDVRLQMAVRSVAARLSRSRLSR